jgi:hypothetical protein
VRPATQTPSVGRRRSGLALGVWTVLPARRDSSWH